MMKFIEAMKRQLAAVTIWQAGILVLQVVIIWQLLAVIESADDASSSAYEAATSASFAAQDAETIKNKLNGF